MDLVAGEIWHILEEKVEGHCATVSGIVAKSVFASGNLFFEAEFS